MNLHNAMHAYPASMAGTSAGSVVVRFLGRLSYASIILFTIGEGGAICSMMPAGYNRDDGILGFKDVVSFGTRIYNRAEPAASLDECFVSRSLPEVGSATVLHGDGIYHAYGRAEPIWCSSTAVMWQVLSEELRPYKDAGRVFTRLCNAVYS